MARYFYTRLVECDNYNDFEEMISEGFCQTVTYSYRDHYYDMNNYCDTFKGFDYTTFYSPTCDVGFLNRIMTSGLIDFLNPEFNIKTKTVTFFENLDKRDRGIRSNPTKMGKFFRKVAPFFNDKQIEFLVNYTISYFAENNYTYNVAKGDEIAEIYLSKAERGRNIGEYSCINASCMRHSDWQIHPTKVYATESWELHYLTNEDEDIGARALVCKEDNTYSYIYASCEHAGNTLEQKLKELGFDNCEEAYNAFDGAKLLKIEGNGGLVAPYIDHHCDVKDCGDHLEITYGYSDYSFNSTSGYVEVAHSCEECGRDCVEEDLVPVDGGLYCMDCVFCCGHFCEYVVGEPVEVYYSRYYCYSVCEDALENMGAVYNKEMNEWQTSEWFAECTEDDEEDIQIEIEPKKEITPGVKCSVISGYNTFHWFPIGTVVKVVRRSNGGLWDCRSVELGFIQHIEEKDLVVVE